mmetsp:Transcript_38523/g.84153  ORF Transcript_38523/g.84153 Transcript_38523/m.84153 type:complete len:85 (+) Transcript_38523:286-540(+)
MRRCRRSAVAFGEDQLFQRSVRKHAVSMEGDFCETQGDVLVDRYSHFRPFSYVAFSYVERNPMGRLPRDSGVVPGVGADCICYL